MSDAENNRPISNIAFKKIETHDMIRTKQLLEKLNPFVQEPNRLNKLKLSGLKTLWEDCSTALVLLDLPSPPDRLQSKKLDLKDNDTLQNNLIDIGPKIESAIDKQLQKREWVLSFAVFVIHIASFLWIFAYQKTAIIPWYLVWGTIILWVFAKGFDRKVLLRERSAISIMPAPQGIILLPIVSLFVLSMIFAAPNHIGLKAIILARVLSPSTLSISCGSSVIIGQPIRYGDIVKLESLSKSSGSCARVATSDGRVGFLPKNKISVMEENTLSQLQYATLWMMGVTLGAVSICRLIYGFYFAKLVPILLERRAAKQNRLLSKKIEETKLLEEFSVGDHFEIGLDLQEAKSQLAAKITQRHDSQAKKIIASKSLSPKEKERMINRLTEWTMEALKTI